MNMKKLLKHTVLASVMAFTAAAAVIGSADTAHAGFEAVGGFGGDEYGSPDLIMPGANEFECPELKFYDKIIFVGDSRTVHMDERVDDERIDFVAASGQGLFWFKNTGTSRLINELLASKKYTTPLPKAIIFNFGVNDLKNKNQYISYLKELAPKLINQNCTLYYMSVNPVDNTIINNIRPDKDITSFNDAIQQKLTNYTYINSHDYLLKTGFKTSDGLHYNSLTYRKIFDYAIEQVNTRTPQTKNVKWENGGLYWFAYNPINGDVYKNRWITYEGGKYYVDKYGRLKTNSWITTASGNRYYVGNCGRYFTSQWVKTGGKYYYLKSNGVMATNQWIGDYFVGSDGAWVN